MFEYLKSYIRCIKLKKLTRKLGAITAQYSGVSETSLGEPVLTQEALDNLHNRLNDMATIVEYNQQMFYSGTITSGITMDEGTTPGNQMYTSSTPNLAAGQNILTGDGNSFWSEWSANRNAHMDDVMRYMNQAYEVEFGGQKKHTTKEKQTSWMKYLVGEIDSKELHNIIKN